MVGKLECAKSVVDADSFMAAVGRNSDEPELKKLFSLLGIGVGCLSDFPIRIPSQRLWTDEPARLQLEFKDAGVLGDMACHDAGEGPWLLTDVIFWGRDKGRDAYAGPLPFGLSFTMDRASVRALMEPSLGTPQVFGDQGTVDVWTFGAIEILVDCAGEGGHRCVALSVANLE